MTDSFRVRVVSGVIIRGGRVLLTQRDPARSDFGHMWESPGGKVELEESDDAALRRELTEELGVFATVGADVAKYAFDPADTFGLAQPVEVVFYDVHIGDQHPMPLQAIGLGWFGTEDVNRLFMVPANAAYRNQLSIRLARKVLYG